jgi:superfamily II DNA or RNA helicase
MTTTGEGVRAMIQEIASEPIANSSKNRSRNTGPKGTKLKCVGFCRSVEHARLMAEQYEPILAIRRRLFPEAIPGVREKAFNRSPRRQDPLSIVFTVDILNEGIDIPSLNMVLFLRPTESSTIFIQQLGRGLRKYEGKDYLTVLDFIANSYTRSVQIALALGSLSKSGSADKRTIARPRPHRRSWRLASRALKSISTKNPAKKRSSPRSSTPTSTGLNFSKKTTRTSKSYLKLKPGEYPKHTDFLNPEVSADLLRYTKKFESYYDFLKRSAKRMCLSLTKNKSR